jgi:hypothetical protein
MFIVAMSFIVRLNTSVVQVVASGTLQFAVLAP